MSQASNPATPGCPVGRGAAQNTAPNGCPISAQAAAFDPFGDAYQQDPPESLRWARAQEPTFYSPQLGYWVVTRYASVQAIFRDHHSYSPAIALEKITPTGDAANAVLASYGYAMNRTLVNEDEPAHMARRRLLMPPFTPEALAHHLPMAQALVQQHIDRFINDGQADLVDQLLWQVPLTVALHFLGVPEEDMALLRQYSIAHTVNTWGRPRPDEQVAVAHAVGKFWQLAGTILDKMRAAPDAPGWMRYGIRVQALHPDVVTDSYLHSMMMAGIVAAHETTANAAANAVKLLLQHPSAWAELCADPALLPGVVEECLRHNGSVAAWRRLAMRNVVIDGQPIPAGSKLLIVMASANHDADHFTDPDLFDIHRDNAGEHLTFGYGAHQCMGKHLARMELQVILGALSRRLPHMQLAAQQFSYVPNTSFRGPEHLRVRWDPAHNPERRDTALRSAHSPARLGQPGRLVLPRQLVVRQRRVLVDDVAGGVVALQLARPDGLALPAWAPGSHIDLACGALDAAGLHTLSRQYSLCGDPAQRDVYEIAVLHEPAGRGGSAWLHAHAQPGSMLAVRGPRNHFKLDAQAQRLLLVAGGIGITPILAMARHALAAGLPLDLHYCGQRHSAMPYLAELQALFGNTPRPDQHLHLHSSADGTRLHLPTLLAQPQPGTLVYACGPQRLLQALEAGSNHWPEDSLRLEHFHASAPAPGAAGNTAFSVTLQHSGRCIPVAADQSLLAALRGAGLDIRSDCQEGLCGACEVGVVSGEVLHRDQVLTRSERASMSLLLSCCARAKSGSLVLDL